MKEVLVCRDNKGKCRIVNISAVFDSVNNLWEIHRSSGLLYGKLTEQPTIQITKGKVKRTLNEQCKLEFNSHVKKYLDKGYKTIQSLGHKTLDTFNPDVDLPAQNTNQQGIVKPQLCKVYDSNDKKMQGIHWLCSKKLDGLRTFIYMKDGELHTASRGGSNYDIAATYIRADVYIKQLLTNNPGLVLDGELYRHGWNLQKISGLGRLEELHEDHKQLRFYCYDYVDEKKPFKERWEFLKSLEVPNDSLLIIVDHVEAFGDDEITKLHDEWVADGYEGLVMRDPNKEYKSGARDRRMCKKKAFVDSEFKVTGFTEGLREEDFVFNLVTEDGKPFEAKPIGDRALKSWYREHMKELVGQMATVKYFHLTPDGIPNLPVLKTFVNKKDK